MEPGTRLESISISQYDFWICNVSLAHDDAKNILQLYCTPFAQMQFIL